MAKTLKLGDRFYSESSIGDASPLVLHDVITDETGERWAIGLTVPTDETVGGIPYVVMESEIDVVTTKTVVALPKKGLK